MPTSTSNSTPAPADSPKDKKSGRTLVLCFDGTAESYDNNITNVVKLHSLLKKDDVEKQLCYYQAGVGTYLDPGSFVPSKVISIFQWFAKTLDQAIAWYLYQHVMDGYKFLMQNYVDGDKVCLFGFSRGAYIARALAGMLHKVGLLSKDNIEQIPFAYNLYTGTDEKLALGFKKAFCRPVPIDFLGVWDTVASVGVMMSPSLPFVDVNTTIRVFRHALSLDEHRAKFRPSLYDRGVIDRDACLLKPPGYKKLAQTDRDHQTRSKKWDKLFDEETDVLEMWFAGCHADIGGGNADNDKCQTTLANIPLRWMIDQIVQMDAPILFDNDDDTAFREWHIPLSIIDKSLPRPKRTVESTNPQVLALDKVDAVQNITNEMFKLKGPLWWFLEMIPTSYSHHNAEDNSKSHTHWSFHLWGERVVPHDALIHSSVKIRKDQAELKYKPRGKP